MKKVSFFLVMLIIFAGCRSDEIEVYRIAKDVPVSAQASIGLAWILPKGWEEEGPSGMRLATFRYEGTETTVVSLPGRAGGDLANANRWRGQIGLGNIASDEFEKGSEFVSTGVGRVRVIDYTGGSKRLVGGILLIDGQSWFFKLTGTKDDVGSAKSGFLFFLKSLTATA